MKAPFPYFGGKSQIAGEVWDLFGEVKNYVEPFAGSLAVLLGRPVPVRGPETVNDLDCLLVNVWWAIRDRPAEVAERLIAPVAEVETESRHAALLRMHEDLRERLGDPEYSDPVAAAWWIKGANEWIGGGWCSGEGPWAWTPEAGWERGELASGVNRKLPHLGDAGTGIYGRRVEWVAGWLAALRDRLCSVRMACGDWRRVLGESVTVKHGLTAVFLDPPYEGTETVYGRDTIPVSEVLWVSPGCEDSRERTLFDFWGRWR